MVLTFGPEGMHSPEIERPSRTFVEIGHGGRPAFALSGRDVPARREYFANVHYIGVDLDEGSHETDHARAAAESGRAPELASAGLHSGRVEELGLAPESVDEVYVANVFAETRIGRGGEQGPLRHALEDTLDAMRVALKPDGMLTVVETNTPSERQLLTRLLHEHGYAVETVVDESDPLEWAKYHGRYAILDGAIRTDEPPYILVARKDPAFDKVTEIDQ